MHGQGESLYFLATPESESRIILCENRAQYEMIDTIDLYEFPWQQFELRIYQKLSDFV